MNDIQETLPENMRRYPHIKRYHVAPPSLYWLFTPPSRVAGQNSYKHLISDLVGQHFYRLVLFEHYPTLTSGTLDAQSTVNPPTFFDPCHCLHSMFHRNHPMKYELLPLYSAMSH